MYQYLPDVIRNGSVTVCLSWKIGLELFRFSIIELVYQLTMTKPIIHINQYKWKIIALNFLVKSISNYGEVALCANSEHVLEEVSNLNCFEIHVRARNF